MDFNSVDAAAAGMNAAQLARIAEHLEQRYIATAKVPGTITAIMRGDRLAYFHCAGRRDIERNRPMTPDTLLRIYSMTKPVTSLALMTLWERGLVVLDDPVSRFLPEFADLRVRTGGAWPLFETRAPDRPMTVRDLLRHTSGLSYDFMRSSNIDYAYRKLRIGIPAPGYTLQSLIDQLAKLPLEFSPGEHWLYSLSTDVLGMVVERIAGCSFPDYLQRTLFAPLGMVDTVFVPRDDQIDRLASCYTRDPQKRLTLQDDGQASYYRGRSYYSGGGGLLSTAADYLRFCRMLAHGGTLDGQRIIGRRTLQLMTANHLPGGGDLASLSISGFSETDNAGVGFGLGFANKIDPVSNGYPASTGTFYWGGMASTLFWVDPKEDLIALFLTQLIPSGTFNFRGQLEAMVYAALD